MITSLFYLFIYFFLQYNCYDVMKKCKLFIQKKKQVYLFDYLQNTQSQNFQLIL